MSASIAGRDATRPALNQLGSLIGTGQDITYYKLRSDYESDRQTHLRGVDHQSFAIDRIEGKSDVSCIDALTSGRCEINFVSNPKVCTVKNKAVVRSPVIFEEI